MVGQARGTKFLHEQSPGEIVTLTGINTLNCSTGVINYHTD